MKEMQPTLATQRIFHATRRALGSFPSFRAIKLAFVQSARIKYVNALAGERGAAGEGGDRNHLHFAFSRAAVGCRCSRAVPRRSPRSMGHASISLTIRPLFVFMLHFFHCLLSPRSRALIDSPPSPAHRGSFAQHRAQCTAMRLRAWSAFSCTRAPCAGREAVHLIAMIGYQRCCVAAFLHLVATAFIVIVLSLCVAGPWCSRARGASARGT